MFPYLKNLICILKIHEYDKKNFTIYCERISRYKSGTQLVTLDSLQIVYIADILTHYPAQLGLLDKVRAIKELVIG